MRLPPERRIHLVLLATLAIVLGVGATGVRRTSAAMRQVEPHRADAQAAELSAQARTTRTAEAIGVLWAFLVAGGATVLVRSERAARRRTEARFRTIMDAAANGLIMADARGEIVLVNREAERMFGYDQGALLGHPIELLVPTASRGRHPSLRAGFVAHPHARPMGPGRDLRGLHKSGTEVPVEIGLTPIQTDDGPAVLATVVDMTVRKQTQDELLRSNEELERFAYVASHDLQEPLRMVASYVQLLGRRYRGRLDPDADDFIGYAVDGALRMQRLIQDLLVYSRVGTQGVTPVLTDASAALDRALASLELAIQESGAVVHRAPLPMVQADPGQLEHLFLNLIGNALKFRGVEAPRIHVGVRREAPAAWCISVRDNGIGIDPEYFERIFVVFQRLHGREQYDGTGIGLAIAKKIVERHGGRLWVDSSAGQGATFSFTLRAGAAA